MTTDIADKTFYVAGQGDSPISEKNAIFTMYCNNKDQLLALQVGEGANLCFQTGAGKTNAYVLRLT